MASSEPRSDGLLAQHQLLLSVINTDWATRLDHKVAAVIIQRYYPKFGNARASMRFIAQAVRADRTNVIDSTRRLVDRGAFSVVREGKGTRPTEYGLNFDFGASGGAPTTTTEIKPSGGVGTTSCGGVDTTTRIASGGVATTESYLPESGLQAEIQDRETIDCAPPSAPPGSALGGPTGAEGHKREKTKFDELYDAYGHRQKRADARDAYTKADPDADMHRVMVESANAWREHWAQQGDPDAPRKTLRKWIETEGYLEDPPKGFKQRETKPKSKPQASRQVAETDETAEGLPIPEFMRGSPRLWPSGRHLARIVGSDVQKQNGETLVNFVFQIDDGGPHQGEEYEHRFAIEHYMQSIQQEGHRHLARLTKACGWTDALEDTNDLHTCIVAVTIDRGEISYAEATDEEHKDFA